MHKHYFLCKVLISWILVCNRSKFKEIFLSFTYNLFQQLLNVFIGIVGIDGTNIALQEEIRKQKEIKLAAEHRAKQEEMQRQKEEELQKQMRLDAEYAKKRKEEIEEMQRQMEDLAAHHKALQEKDRLALELQEQMRLDAKAKKEKRR